MNPLSSPSPLDTTCPAPIGARLRAIPGGGSEPADGPTLVIDSREQQPLPLQGPWVRAALQTGDYSIRGLEHLLAVERKSIADLVGCCMGKNRERFERELHRLRGFRFRRLLIVGQREDVEERRYHSGIKPKAVLASLAAFEIRYDVPVVWARTPEDAAELVEGWARWFAREVLKDAKAACNGAVSD